jgi:thiamine pyrophosphokinase
MIPRIVLDATRLTLLGGGPARDGDVAAAIELAPILVAADGGADRALAMGQTPDWVVGDLDSLSEHARASLDPSSLHRVAEQDDTDLDKCVRLMPDVPTLALGFTGGRLDHTLAAFSTLLRNPDRRILLVAEEELIFAAPPDLRLEPPPGARLSLYPMSRLGVEGSGLRWPLEGLILSPEGRIGTSNEVTGPVRLQPEMPGLLVLLERETESAVQLAQVMAALAAAPRWRRS